MGGLLVLVLVGLYLWIAYVAVRKVPKVWGKALALVVVVLIPTADAVYGRLKLKHLCETEGGMKIIKAVEGVEGFDVDSSSPTSEWLTKYGYQFVEGTSLGGKPMRLRRGSEGKILEEQNIVPQSRYRYEYSGGDFGAGYALAEYRIRDVQTNEILARNKNISYEGGWVERLIARIYAAKGYAGACQDGAERISAYKLVTETLKPSK